MIPFAAELARGLLDLVLPARCAACEALGVEPLCAVCEGALLPAAPFELEGLATAQACFEYGGPIAAAISRFKYEGREDTGRALAALFAAHATVGEAEVIVPVPLSRRRLVERGFNQAVILSRGLELPVDTTALKRVRDTRSQVGASRERRALNVRDAFEVRASQRISGKAILLVDDVITTGATVGAAAAALRAAGAASVSALALARAEHGLDASFGPRLSA